MMLMNYVAELIVNAAFFFLTLESELSFQKVLCECECDVCVCAFLYYNLER